MVNVSSSNWKDLGEGVHRNKSTGEVYYEKPTLKAEKQRYGSEDMKDGFKVLGTIDPNRYAK